MWLLTSPWSNRMKPSYRGLARAGARRACAPRFWDRCKGISQRFLHLRVARYEFLHHSQPLPWHQTCAATLRSMFSTPGDYWRRMAHQPRRLPLTLCYR
jgi:hypothetical protein